MKILIATGIYPPDIGGPATYSKLLFEELPKKGIEVEILSFGEVRRLPKIIRHFAYFLKVLKRARKADLIFAQDPVSVGLPAAIAAKILRKKFVLKVVGAYAWEQFQNKKSKIKNQNYKSKFKNLKKPFFVSPEEFQEGKYGWLTELRRRIEGWVAKAADKIIVPSQYLKKIVLMWGAEENKITVVYNAFNAPELKMSKEDARKKIAESRQLKADSFLIISAGRLVPWKGFAALIEIMPEVLKEIPDAKLFIIGDGPEREALKTLIANKNLQGTVFLAGQLSHEDSLSYLRAGDLFVLNTGYEGFSHFILEAMALEIPVITTNVGGNPEAITSGREGILVEYGNKEQLKEAILKLAKNEESRRKLANNAKEKIKEFNKERMLGELIEILKN